MIFYQTIHIRVHGLSLLFSFCSYSLHFTIFLVIQDFHEYFTSISIKQQSNSIENVPKRQKKTSPTDTDIPFMKNHSFFLNTLNKFFFSFCSHKFHFFCTIKQIFSIHAKCSFSQLHKYNV